MNLATKSDYVELRCRSAFSFLDGASLPEELIAAAAARGHDTLALADPNGVYGAYAYGLSGYSSVIHDWRWGGLVGLHGTNDPSGIGRVVSHGCIRMLNQDITRLERVLPLGTPIAIV